MWALIMSLLLQAAGLPLIGGHGIPSTTVADPTQLPVANKQTNPDPGFLADITSAKTSGTDPTTGVTIWRVTDGSWPVASSDGRHDYSDGGPFISQPWTSGGKTYYSLVVRADSQWYVVEFNYTDGTFTATSLSTLCDSFDLCRAWSLATATPRHLWVITGSGTVRRVNTATMAYDDPSGFPWNPSGVGSDLDWLQVSDGDEWVVCQLRTDGGTIYGKKVVGGTTCSWSGEEPHMQRSSGVQLGVNDAASGAYGTAPWYYKGSAGGCGSRSNLEPPNHENIHPCGGEGYIFSNTADGSQPQYYWIRHSDQTMSDQGPIGAWRWFHSAAQWLIRLGNDSGDQLWFIMDSQGGGDGLIVYAIGFARVDFDDSTSKGRLLCHHDSTEGSYYRQCQATLSPDGKLVMFASDMNNGSGRVDVFLAEVPV